MTGIRIALLDARGDYVRVHYLESAETCRDGFFAGVHFDGIEIDWEPEDGWSKFDRVNAPARDDHISKPEGGGL